MFVLDCSVTLSWCFEDETSPEGDAILAKLMASEAHVPALWPFEVANGVLMGQRRGCITQSEVSAFARQLAQLVIIVEPTAIVRSIDTLIPLAERERLTVYDAAYLDLAMRLSAPLATSDKALRSAARRRNVALLPE